MSPSEVSSETLEREIVGQVEHAGPVEIGHVE